MQVIDCKNCDCKMELRPPLLLGIDFSFRAFRQCDECSAIVAVRYRGQAVQPEIAIRPSWNPTLIERAVQIGESLYYVDCHTRKNFIAVWLLQVISQHERGCDIEFANRRPDRAGLLFDPGRDRLIGYVTWTVTDSEGLVLRQLYIVPEERRRGFATKLVRHWVKHEARGTFDVDNLNYELQQLLVKAGFATVEGDKIRGVG